MAKYKLEDGTEIEAFTAAEFQEKVDVEVAGLKAKRDELLGLHSKDKERLGELEAAQLAAEEARQKEKGEFKSLYEKTQTDLETERENARKFRQEIQAKDQESAANAITADLTRDTKRAELLKKEALQYAKNTENGVVFEVGGVEVSAEKLKEKLAADYPFLVDGSGASGGGAQGGTKNGQAGKWSDYTPSELSGILKSDPERYDYLKTTR